MALRIAFIAALEMLLLDKIVFLEGKAATESGQPMCLQLCQAKESPCEKEKGILMTLHMTPLWIEGHASYIDSVRTTTVLQMTFNKGSVNNAALLKIPLITAGHLDDSEPLTVEITVAHDTNIGNTDDSDIRYGVSDGTRFVGFETNDRGNYAQNSPCYGIEGTSGQTITSFKRVAVKPKIGDSLYPGLFVFTFKLSERWGSCYTAHGNGYTKVTGYDHRLTLSKGLNLDVYKSEKVEKVGIKYIKVIIMKDA